VNCGRRVGASLADCLFYVSTVSAARKEVKVTAGQAGCLLCVAQNCNWSVAAKIHRLSFLQADGQ
jgi:hypothetical protein